MSMSTSSGSSTSVPTVTETPENSIIDQISGVASGLAGQMYNWAQGVFAQTSAISNQAIGNFFQVSQNMLGLSNTMTGQYNNLFAPENAQLVADANSYNSEARQKVDMGQAGATAAQAGAAGVANSEEALRSYGIDVSSGRYAGLDRAAAVQNAANVAGAENTQRNADVATGQRLRSEAVQVGATLPAAIANVNNTGIQANVGAVNSALGNANTGAALMKLPNDYLSTAMNVKLPPVGQTSQSSQNSNSRSPDPGQKNSPSGGSGGQGGGGPGAGNGGQAWNPVHGGGGQQGFTPNPYFNPTPADYSDPSGQNYNPMAGIDPNSFDGGGIYQPQDGYGMGVGDAGTNAPIDYTGGNGGAQNPFEQSGFGQTFGGGQDQTFGGMGGGTDTQYGDISYNPGANSVDPGWANNYDQPSPDTNWGNGADQYGGGADTTSPSSDFSAGDYTPPSDNYDMGGAYAQGGPISPSQSPSGGMQTDDIAASGPGGRPLQMNANEFVIPQDVALWKGQEFFQKLIDQSRKGRIMAPAKPQVAPQQAMR